MQKSWRFYSVLYFCLSVIFIAIFFVGFNIYYPLRYKNLIIKNSYENELDSGFVASLIYAESRFNKNSKSNKGAIGLMQILPTTASAFFDGEFEENVLYDAETNIIIGTKFLKYLFDKYLDEITVLACYNAGEGVVRSWMGEDNILQKNEILYKETKKYVDKVLRYKKMYSLRLKY